LEYFFTIINPQKKKKGKHIACAMQGPQERGGIKRQRACKKGNEPAKKQRRLGEKNALASCNLCNSKEVMRFANEMSFDFMSLAHVKKLLQN
jgi:hypothetical protein